MNKLNTVSITDIEYMRNRIRYYKEMPTPKDLLALLDEVGELTDNYEMLQSYTKELEEDNLEEEGYNRAISDVHVFFNRVARGTEEYSPERLASFLEERK